MSAVTLAREMGAMRAWAIALPLDVVVTAGVGVSAAGITRSLTDPPIACRDIKALGAQARSAGRPLVVDVSVMGPRACMAVRRGAHVALAELDGNLTVVGVSKDVERVAPGACDRIDALWQASPADAEEAAACMARRDADWHTVSDAAQVVAAYLRCHPRVEELRYPGLRSDDSFTIAARTLEGGFGPWVDVRVCGQAGWQRITCNSTDAREQVMSLERKLSGELVSLGASKARSRITV